VLHLQIIRFLLSKRNGLHAVTSSCPTMRVISSEPSRISLRYLRTDFVLNMYIACTVSLHAAIPFHLHETRCYSEPWICRNNRAVIRCWHFTQFLFQEVLTSTGARECYSKKTKRKFVTIYNYVSITHWLHRVVWAIDQHLQQYCNSHIVTSIVKCRFVVLEMSVH